MKQTFLLLVAVVWVGVQLKAGDWPNWRGPNHNGISTETGWSSDWPAAGPKVLWRADVGTGFSSFAVIGDRVFTMGNEDDEDSVVCLNVDTGEEMWRHTYAEPKAPNLYEGGPNSTPTADDGRVYTLSRQGKLFCLDAQNGEVKWSKDLVGEHGVEIPKQHWGLSGSPLVQGRLLIVNAGRAGMAFEKDSGKLVWETGSDPAAYATPVPFERDGSRGILVFAAKALVALDLTGRELWQYPWKTDWDINAADPILSGDQVFITSGYNHGATLLRINGGSPTSVWENKNMRSQLSGGVLWKDHVYGIDDNQLRCIQLDTGAVRWTERSIGKGTVTMADGKLIVLSEKGELLVAEASPTAFRPTARAQVLGGKCWTVPVLANGRIFARNAAGTVVCLDVRAN